GIHRGSLCRYWNYLRVAPGAARAATKSRGSSQTRKQRHGRSRIPPNAQRTGDFGSRNGARAADRGGPAAAELSTFIGGGSWFSRGPHPDDGSAAGDVAFCASQQDVAARLDPTGSKAVRAI